MVTSDGFFSSNLLQIYDTRFKFSNSKPESQAQVFSLINVFIFISFSYYSVNSTFPFSTHSPRKKGNLSESSRTICSLFNSKLNACWVPSTGLHPRGPAIEMLVTVLILMELTV